MGNSVVFWFCFLYCCDFCCLHICFVRCWFSFLCLGLLVGFDELGC